MLESIEPGAILRPDPEPGVEPPPETAASPVAPLVPLAESVAAGEQPASFRPRRPGEDGFALVEQDRGTLRSYFAREYGGAGGGGEPGVGADEAKQLEAKGLSRLLFGRTDAQV